MTAAIRSRASRGVTLVELLVFSAIASLVLMAAIGFLVRGGRIIGLGQQSSAAQIELRSLLEALTRDVEELEHLEQPGEYDSAAGGGSAALAFTIVTPRPQGGGPGAGSFARVLYRCVADGPGGARCERSAAKGGAPPEVRTVARSVTRLRLVPMVAVPDPLRHFRIVASTDPACRAEGAGPICILADISIGQESKAQTVGQAPVTSVAAKLWCRNRLLELARGGGS